MPTSCCGGQFVSAEYFFGRIVRSSTQTSHLDKTSHTALAREPTTQLCMPTSSYTRHFVAAEYLFGRPKSPEIVRPNYDGKLEISLAKCHLFNTEKVPFVLGGINMSFRVRNKSLAFSESQQRLVNFVNIRPLPIIFCGSNVLLKNPNDQSVLACTIIPLKGSEAI